MYTEKGGFRRIVFPTTVSKTPETQPLTKLNLQRNGGGGGGSFPAHV